LAGLLPASVLVPRALRALNINPLRQSKTDNVLVVVFDAWSAYHLSTYGYQRETMPNLVRLAKRAVVYHNHYAGGNFTTPGTASLLTGTLPWTHRALQPNGTVATPLVSHNFFHAFQSHYRIAYTHNPWANKLLEQFSDGIDELVPRLSLFLESYDQYIRGTFKKDEDIASTAWTRNVDIAEQGYAYSLFFSHINEAIRKKNIENIEKEFPRGIPSIGTAENSFVLEDAIKWVGNRLAEIPQPFLGYFHFLPPHGPYRTSQEFYNDFSQDGYKPVDKPEDIFTQNISKAELMRKRNAYDEFLLYADREFSKLFDKLETSGLLNNTWVIVTSDHGEMFERGIDGHSVDALYQPVIQVPLMIFEPGRENGMDIHIPTSAIDILPTMLHVTGQETPDWAEGDILPPYTATSPVVNRSVYTVRSNKTDQSDPIERGSLTLTKGHYKLHYYFGYEERGVTELIKLYNVDEDPEELADLASSQQDITTELFNELKQKLDSVNQPYL